MLARQLDLQHEEMDFFIVQNNEMMVVQSQGMAEVPLVELSQDIFAQEGQQLQQILEPSALLELVLMLPIQHVLYSEEMALSMEQRLEMMEIPRMVMAVVPHESLRQVLFAQAVQ